MNEYTALHTGIQGRSSQAGGRAGLPRSEVAARLGVSAHSLYKWVKAVMPTKDEKQSAELVEAKSEILRLRSQMRRLEEERDLLKKAARYFAREPE
jgi:transposase